MEIKSADLLTRATETRAVRSFPRLGGGDHSVTSSSIISRISSFGCRCCNSLSKTMASWWSSDRLYLVSSDDPRKGTPTGSAYEGHVDHAAAVKRLQMKFGFSNVTIKFDKNHQVRLDANATTGKYGCPRVESLTVRDESMSQPLCVPWVRNIQESCWTRPFHPKSIEMSTKHIMSVLADALVMGTFSFAEIPDHVVPFLGESLRLAKMNVLEIVRTPLTDGTARMLSHVLKTSTTLTHLNLRGCNLGQVGPESMKVLCESLEGSQLQSFSFSGSHKVLAMFFHGLRGNPTLTEIKLDRHTFETMDFDGLIKVLSCSSITVNRLDLEDTKLSLEQVKRLAGVLTGTNTVKELTMESCGIPGEGMLAFASELPQMASLETLNLRGNDCGQEAADALRVALEKGTASRLRKLQFEKVGPYYGPCCAPPNYFYDCSDDCLKTIAYQLELNRGARTLINHQGDVPVSIWPVVFERVQKKNARRNDTLYYLLQEKAVTFADLARNSKITSWVRIKSKVRRLNPLRSFARSKNKQKGRS